MLREHRRVRPGRNHHVLFAVIYRYADDAAALDEHRPRHRDHLRGRCTRRGASSSAARWPRAAAPAPAADLPRRAAEQVAGWLEDDPFKVLGLIVEREIRAWNPCLRGRPARPAARVRRDWAGP